jgi:hypothetical protein
MNACLRENKAKLLPQGGGIARGVSEVVEITCQTS